MSEAAPGATGTSFGGACTQPGAAGGPSLTYR